MNPREPNIHEDHRDGAFVIVKRKSDGAILVADALYGRGLGMLPGGGIFHGETPRAAAARELKEEFGIAIPERSLRHWGHFNQRSRGDKPDGPLLDGFLFAFEAEIDLEDPPAHLNDEAANQRFVLIGQIFEAGEAAYGTSCLRLLALRANARDGEVVEGRMRDKVSVSGYGREGDPPYEF